MSQPQQNVQLTCPSCQQAYLIQVQFQFTPHQCPSCGAMAGQAAPAPQPQVQQPMQNVHQPGTQPMQQQQAYQQSGQQQPNQQAPYSASTPMNSFAATPEPANEVDNIRKVILGQKYLIAAILMCFVSILLSVVHWSFGFAVLGSGVVGAVGICTFGDVILSKSEKWIFVFGMILLGVSGLIMLVVNAKATRYLKERNIEVGLMGGKLPE